MNAFTITPLTQHTGAAVSGLDVTGRIDGETRAALNRALGCRELLSEDMSHGQEVEGVLIVNPFR